MKVNIKRLFKTKTGITFVIMLLSSLVIGLSYGAFVYVTDGYKATELMIGNLMYGIDITTTGGEETISGTSVTLTSGKTATVLVKITSLNSIKTNYGLDYKINSGTGNIYYAESTGWLPSGKISKNSSGIYEKTIKVVIQATSDLNVSFNVSGGYSHNTEVTPLTGYTRITEAYDNILTLTTGKPLVDVMDDPYGGETKTNYLQYPENSDKTKNLWRIIGQYDSVGGIKIISESVIGTSTQSNITSTLNAFYNTLTKTSDYVLSTNKFNCTGTNCTTSSYTNIGLLSSSEYDEGTYMNISDSWYVQESGTLKTITSGILGEATSSSGVRPVIYLQNDVSVTGSGTKSNPYILVEKGDIKIASATLNGTALDYFPKSTSPYLISSVSCTNGSVGKWDSDRNTIRLTTVNIPTECNVEFKDGHTVTMNVTNGTSSPSSAMVGRNGETTFTITPNSGYKLSGSTVTCDGEAVGTITSSGVKVSNIIKNQTCSVTLTKNLPTLAEAMLRDNPTVSERTNFTMIISENTTGTLGYTGESFQTEDGSNVYYYVGNTTNNWVKFGGFYWRIIRTNEDGSVRMLYSGTSHNTVSGYIGKSAFNSNYTNPMYVGYMYGTSGSLENNRTNENDSTIKTYLDTWYQNNLLTNYDKYVSKTAIYCSDRSVGEDEYNTGSTSFYFGANTRLDSNKVPSYKCGSNVGSGLFESTQAVADKFSASTEGGGNGQLKYPIALMTADEVAFAGGVYLTPLSSPYVWYYTNSEENSITGVTTWWLLSPDHWAGRQTSPSVFSIYASEDDGSGDLGATTVRVLLTVRPVISLSSCAKVNGTGTPTDPYVVDESASTC